MFILCLIRASGKDTSVAFNPDRYYLNDANYCCRKLFSENLWWQQRDSSLIKLQRKLNNDEAENPLNFVLYKGLTERSIVGTER